MGIIKYCKAPQNINIILLEKQLSNKIDIIINIIAYLPVLS